MKLYSILLYISLFVWACSQHQADETTQVEVKTQYKADSRFQQILDDVKLKGAIVIFDGVNETYYFNDSLAAVTERIPASTFKVPNTLIALETGVVESDTTLFQWDGEERPMKRWERDMTFHEAYQLSCVPVYRQIARDIGVDRMRRYIDSFEYGTMNIDSNNIDLFWLFDGSGISPMGQIEFLRKLYERTLSLSDRTYSIAEKMMVIDTLDGSVLRGKTGWSTTNGDNGWFVGYLEMPDGVRYVAVNVDPTPNYDMEYFATDRIKIAKRALLESFD